MYLFLSEYPVRQRSVKLCLMDLGETSTCFLFITVGQQTCFSVAVTTMAKQVKHFTQSAIGNAQALVSTYFML